MSIVTAIVLLVLILAFAIMVGRVVGRQQNLICAMAVGGAFMVALTVSVIVSMHCLKIPVTTVTLLAVYIPLTAIFAGAHFATCRRMPWVITSDITRVLLPGLALFAIIILPFTHFTGIDTYKWQDLATAINLEQNIPWLVHPLSLLGFTPRSYPSAQPIMLATIQIIGNLGIDSGFAVLSIFIAGLGCASAYFFGLRAFAKPHTAAIYALLYIFTPVFTRYTHWATGRGLFLAIFPLLLATLIGGRRSGVGGRKSEVGGQRSEVGGQRSEVGGQRSEVGGQRSEVRGRKSEVEKTGICYFIVHRLSFIVLALLLLLLLALSHKVGFIIAISFIPIYLSGFLIPKQSRRLPIIISILPFAALALLVVSRTVLPFPFGNALGIMRYSLTRFGLLMPLALFGLIAPNNLFGSIKWRRLYPLMLIAIPLAFERHMYGALIAAPLITLAATEGIVWLWSKYSVVGGQWSVVGGRRSEIRDQRSEAKNCSVGSMSQPARIASQSDAGGFSELQRARRRKAGDREESNIEHSTSNIEHRMKDQRPATSDQEPRTSPFSALCSVLFCAITIAFTIATVVHRSRIATPSSVYHAAQFLEKHDPTGPFVIYAPGRARTQIQAYVSGCPRFNLTTGKNSLIQISAPPDLKGSPRKVLQNWTNYMRGFMTVPEIATDWYGKNPRKYYITVNDQGSYPPNTKQIYNKNGVQIYTP